MLTSKENTFTIGMYTINVDDIRRNNNSMTNKINARNRKIVLLLLMETETVVIDSFVSALRLDEKLFEYRHFLLENQFKHRETALIIVGVLVFDSYASLHYCDLCSCLSDKKMCFGIVNVHSSKVFIG